MLPVQKILYAVAALIVVLLAIGLALPRTARVQTGIAIDAYPATVFALANDFRRRDLWAPANGGDANARIAYSGPSRGVGATVSWDGPVVGTGSSTIVASDEYTRIATILNAGEPGEASSELRFEPTATGTQVTQLFEHDYGYNVIGRYFGLLWVRMLREQHARELAALKPLAEAMPRSDFASADIEHLVHETQPIAWQRARSAPGADAFAAAVGRAYFDILRFVDEQGLTEAGPPMSIARGYDGAELQFDAAIPVSGVSESTPREGPGVRIGASYAGPVVRLRHTGSYRGLAAAHREIAAYIAALGLERAGDSWEVYVSDPARVAEAELITDIYYPVYNGAP